MDTTRIVLRATARLYQRISAQLILLAAFFGLVWFLVYFTINSSYAVRLFDGLANAQFRGRIAWSRITWGPLPWRIEILEPVLVGAHDRPIITADAVEVGELRLLELLSGRIAASDITIVRPVVRLTGRPHPEAFDEMGRPKVQLDLPQMFWPPGPLLDDGQPGGPPPLDFEDIRIERGTFVLDMPFVSITTEGIDVSDGRFEMRPGPEGPVMGIGAGELRLDRGSVRVLRGETATAPLDARREEVYAFPVEGLRLRHFRWHGERFSVARLAARHRGDRLLVDNYRMRLDTPGIPWMAARVELAVQDVATHLAQFGVEGVSGPALLTVEGRGEIDAFDGRVTAAGDGLQVGPVRFERYVLAARKDPDDRLHLDGLEVGAFGGRVTVEGGVGLRSGRAWAEVWPVDIDPTALPIELDRRLQRLLGGGVSGPIFAHVAELFDHERVITASADLRFERRGRPMFGLGPSTRLRLDGRMAGTAITVSRLDLDSGSTALDARGGLDLDGMGAALSGRLAVGALGPALAELGLDLSGAVTLDWKLSGALDAPLARATFDGRDVRFAPIPAVDVKGKADFRGGWLSLDDVIIDPRDRSDRDARIAVRGRIGVDRPRIPLDLRVDARGIDLGPLPLGPVAGDIGGRVDVVATVGGTARRPKGSVKGRVLRPRWKALDFRLLRLEGSYDGATARVDDLALFGRAEQPLLDASGRFTPRTGAYAGEIALERIPLTLVEKIAPPEVPRPEHVPYPLRGSVSARLSGEGTLEEPALDGAVTIDGLGYEAYALGEGALQVGASERTLTVTGRLFDRFDVDVRMPTVDDGRETTGTVRFEKLAVERLLPQLAEQPLETELTGAVTARLDVFEGRLKHVGARLDGLRARYTLDGDPFVVAAPFPVEVGFDGRRAEIGALTLSVVRGDAAETGEEESRAEVEVRGGVTLEERDGKTRPMLDLAATVGADLPLVQPLAASVFTGMTGRAEAELSFEGPADDIRPAGTVRIDDASLVPRSSTVGSLIEFDSARFRIRPMPEGAPAIGTCRDAKVRGKRRRPHGAFVLDLPPEAPQLTVVRDESTVALDELSVEFRRFVPDRIRVRVNGDDLALNVPRVLRGTFDVDDVRVELCQHQSEGPDRMRLIVGPGAVEVVQGEYTADITSVSEINRGFTDNLRGAAATRTVSVFERVPLLQQLYFDGLEATCEGDFYVRNQITVLTLDLELKFALERIQGLLTERSGAEELKIAGDMSIMADSQLIYARRPFEVTRGDVIFGQNSVIDADVEATHTFRLRADESGTTTTFDQGGGDVRLEEVTLRATYRLRDWQSPADLNIEMSSNSGLSSYEIVVLVLTGSLPDTLGGVASAQPATELLLGPLLGLIERPLEDTLDVDLSLTPASSGTLFIDADKLLSRRLRLYSRTLVGDEDGTIPQTFGLEYSINNTATAELTNESAGNLNSTSGRLRLRFELD